MSEPTVHLELTLSQYSQLHAALLRSVAYFEVCETVHHHTGNEEKIALHAQDRKQAQEFKDKMFVMLANALNEGPR